MENDLETRLQAALDACAKMQDQRDQALRALTRSGFTLVEGAQEWKPPIGPSASPLLDRIDLLTFLLRELRDGVDGEWCFPGNLDERIDAALAGNLPERPDTEWTDATSTPTSADYRELQAQHDQVQSKYKAALDMLRWARGYVEYATVAAFNMNNDDVIEAVERLPELDAVLAAAPKQEGGA